MLDTNVEQTQGDSPETQGTSPDVPENNLEASNNSAQQAMEALLELDKHTRFKFDGQEYTPEELKKAIMRQADYTKKTQALSSEKKTFEEESKFQKNLAFDLWALREDPSLLQQFLQTYPHQYHEFAKHVLALDSQRAQQPQSAGQQKAPQQDVELLSRLSKLEKHFETQDVQKNELFLQNHLDKIPSLYDASYKDVISELVMSRVYNLHASGTKITDEVMATTIKQVGDRVTGLAKATKGELINKQIKANKKGADVESGGGTPGSAPKKFKNFEEAAEASIKQLNGR